MTRIKGTPADMRCDHCGRISRTTIHAVMAQLPAVVMALPGDRQTCIPPVTVHFGLCPECKEKDLAPTPDHPNAGVRECQATSIPAGDDTDRRRGP
jgi:hypothetical protein